MTSKSMAASRADPMEYAHGSIPTATLILCIALPHFPKTTGLTLPLSLFFILSQLPLFPYVLQGSACTSFLQGQIPQHPQLTGISALVFQTVCENSDHIFKPSYANQGAVDHLHTEASGAIRGWGQGPPQAVGKCSSRKVRGGQASFNVISPPRPASQEGKCDLRVTQQPKYLPHQSLV